MFVSQLQLIVNSVQKIEQNKEKKNDRRSRIKSEKKLKKINLRRVKKNKNLKRQQIKVMHFLHKKYL